MPKFNTPVTIPKDFNAGIPNYEYKQVIFQESEITAKIWPGVIDRDSLFRSDNIFVLDADGEIKASSSHEFQMENFGDLAYLGRLYARDNDGYLRQIQMEIKNENTLEFNISAPVTIPEPTAPSFWTKVFAFFGHQASKNLIQAYEAATAFASALTVLESSLTADINLHPPKDVLDAAADVIVEDAFEASHIRQDSVENEHNGSLIEEENFLNSDHVFFRADSIPNINENGNKELSSDEKSGFFHDLAKASKFTAQNVQEALDDAFFDYQNYAQALSNLLIAQAAQLLLSVKNLNLNAAKPIFEGLQKSAEEFVYSTYNEEIREIANLKMVQGDDQLATQKSNELVDNVCRTGLNHLLTHMNKEEQNRNRNFEEVAQNIKQAMKENSSPSLFN